MKKVFSNGNQVAHVWAQQTQSVGGCSNVFFEGAAIYSYDYHYPLGFFATNKKGEKAAIINNAGYSVTTSKHIQWARSAVSHYKTFLLPNTEAIKACVNAAKWEQPERIVNGLSEAITHSANRYNSRLRSDTVKRKAATLDKWKSETLAECENYIALLEWYGLKMDAKAKAALKAITGKSPIEAREAAQKAALVEAKKREKLLAEKLKVDAVIIEEALKAWLVGDDYFVSDTGHGKHCSKDWVYRNPETLLRVHGEEVQTSKGAQFPIAHAVKAFALIQTVMKSGEVWIKNGKTLHLGNFQVDRIEPCGTVLAGCHTVKYDAIESIAKQLKLL